MTAVTPTANNQVSGFLYDGAGDVKNDGQNQYLYDAEGRLCASQPVAGGVITGYLYDADGTRVAKGTLAAFSCDPGSNGFATTKDYILGPGGEQVTEMTVSGSTSTWAHTNAWVGGKILATYDSATNNTVFYVSDWLGTKRVEVGANPCATAYASLPFGENQTPPSVAGYSPCQDDVTEHHFTGKERDTESGNDYFGARYYASSMGRFMSPDWSAKVQPVPYSKLDDPQSLNLYQYVRNNPLLQSGCRRPWRLLPSLKRREKATSAGSDGLNDGAVHILAQGSTVTKQDGIIDLANSARRRVSLYGLFESGRAGYSGLSGSHNRSRW